MPERDRQVLLPVPGGPSRTMFSRPAGSRAGRGAARCRGGWGLEGEVELLQGLAGGEAGGLDAALAAVAVAAVDLGLEQRCGELLKAPLLARGRGRRAWAAPARRRAPSARGTGARARTPGGSCDQPVIARQRAVLDCRLRGGRGARSRWRLQRAGVLERGDRAVLRERARVAAGELAGVQRDRDDSRWSTRTSTRRPTRSGSSE